MMRFISIARTCWIVSPLTVSSQRASTHARGYHHHFWSYFPQRLRLTVVSSRTPSHQRVTTIACVDELASPVAVHSTASYLPRSLLQFTPSTWLDFTMSDCAITTRQKRAYENCPRCCVRLIQPQSVTNIDLSVFPGLLIPWARFNSL